MSSVIGRFFQETLTTIANKFKKGYSDGQNGKVSPSDDVNHRSIEPESPVQIVLINDNDNTYVLIENCDSVPDSQKQVDKQYSNSERRGSRDSLISRSSVGSCGGGSRSGSPSSSHQNLKQLGSSSPKPECRRSPDNSLRVGSCSGAREGIRLSSSNQDLKQLRSSSPKPESRQSPDNSLRVGSCSGAREGIRFSSSNQDLKQLRSSSPKPESRQSRSCLLPPKEKRRTRSSSPSILRGGSAYSSSKQKFVLFKQVGFSEKENCVCVYSSASPSNAVKLSNGQR